MHTCSKLSSMGLNPDPAINYHAGVSQAGRFINVCRETRHHICWNPLSQLHKGGCCIARSTAPHMDVKLGVPCASIIV